MEGVDITDLPPYKRDTSMVFQSLALFPNMTVFDNVAYGLKIRGLPRIEIEKRVDEVLELVRIKELKDRRVTKLSGGQMQRVAIARSLVLHPKVLLLDEPLGALDLKLRKELHVELKRLHEEVGNTWIFVTHDQEEALTLADRIGIMNNGAIEQIGDKWDLYEKPATKFVAEFIGETNLIMGRVASLSKDIIKVDWGGISIDAPAIQDVSVGDEVYVSLRPEYIYVSDKPIYREGGFNILRGLIIDEIFKGSYVTYYVKLGNGEVIKATLLSKDAEYDVGDKVYISWEYDKGVTIKD